MEFSDFAELVEMRRTIRRFKSDPVPDEYIEKILKAARWAPSGANAQPWEFIVVKDQGMKEKIEELYNRLVNESARTWETTQREDLRHWAIATGKTKLAEAPVIIVPIGDVRTVYASVVIAHVMFPYRTLENMTNVTMLIHLAATALGLGSRWNTINEPMMGPLKVLLGVPEIYHIYSIVPIGYPAYEPAPGYRKEFGELIHFDNYDMSKYRSDEKLIEYLASLRKHTRGGYIHPGHVKKS